MKVVKVWMPRRARGWHDNDNVIIMLYLNCGIINVASYPACLQSTITGSVDTSVDSMYSSGSFVPI